MTITKTKLKNCVAGHSFRYQPQPGQTLVRNRVFAAGTRGIATLRFLRTSLTFFVAVILLSGCESVDFKRITYDFLRQEDCRRNDVDVYEFCSRTFVFEYDEYEQLRQEYMRSERDKILIDRATRERYSSMKEGV